MAIMRVRKIGSVGVKVCSKCGEEKSLDEFYKREGARDGHRADCKVCKESVSKKWKKDNPDKRKEIHKRGELKRLYGITLETFNEMSESQNHKCSICGERNPDGTRLCVDHDHSTGAVRELLCKNCNVALGNLRDNPLLCIKAAEYLTRHKE